MSIAIPEVLYGKHDFAGMVTTRYGSAKIGVVLTTIRTRHMHTAYLGQVGRLGVNYGPCGGVEAGLAELTPEQRGPCRIFYRKNGIALALNWAGRKGAKS